MATRPLSEYVASRRIGDATVTIIREGTFSWAPHLQVPEAAWREAMPEANEHGEISLDVNVMHIALGSASVLLDPGFEDPTSAHQRVREAKWPDLRRTAGMQAALLELGIRPAEITHVVITHAHDDHYAGVAIERDGRYAARFPHARHLIGRGDWDGNPERAQPDSELTRRLGAIDELGLLDVVDDAHHVVSGITLIHAPGETPGHSIVRLQSGGESLYYLGDLFHHVCEVEHPDWVPARRDAAALRASRARLIAAAAAERATLVFTHEHFPAWGRVVPAAGGYRWEQA